MKKIQFFIPGIMVIFSLLVFSQHPTQIQSHIQELENLIDNHLNSWEYKEKDVLEDHKEPLAGLKWKKLPSQGYIKAKVFSLQKEFKVPDTFAGVPVEGNKLFLNCQFRGVGVYEGEFLINKNHHKSFQLNFGNHSSNIEKEFLLVPEAKPGEKILLFFRFENKGRLPLVQNKEVEPGTF